MQPVAVEHGQDPAREGRLDAGQYGPGGARGIDRHGQHVGLAVIGRGSAPPARPETKARRRLAIGREDFEPIASGGHMGRQPGVTVGSERHVSSGNARVVDGLLELPAAIAEVAVVHIIFEDELPLGAGRSRRFSIAVEGHEVETRVRILGDVVLVRADADQAVGGMQRLRQLGRGGAPVDIVHGDFQRHFERGRRVGSVARRERHGGVALVVRGETLRVEGLRQERLLHEAKTIGFETRKRVLGRLHGGVHLPAQRRAGTAVEIVRRNRCRDGAAGVEACRRHGELGLEPRRHEILDRDARAAELLLAGRTGPERPVAGIGVVGDVNVERAAACPVEVQGEVVGLDPIGAHEMHRQGRLRNLMGVPVAQQGAEVERFPGSVDAAVRP